MSVVPQYTPHYTVTDYEQWQGDWELWAGVPVAMSPAPQPIHQLVAANLARHIGNELTRKACTCRVLHEVDWRIDDNTLVRPDVVVICQGIPDLYLDYSPTLVVEVLSPSTAEKDRTAKYQLYAANGVKYYLMVDPATRTYSAFQLEPSGYVAMPADSELPLQLTNDCQIQLPTAHFFD